LVFTVQIVTKGCGKIRLDELLDAYKVCKDSQFREGRDLLVEKKAKLLNSKCVVITKCYDCPFYSWTGEGICMKSGQNIPDRHEVADFCPLNDFNDWEKILWGVC